MNTQSRLHTRTQRCCQELPVTLIGRSRAHTRMMMMNTHAHAHSEHTGAETEASRPPAAASPRVRRGAACPWGPVLPIAPVGVRQSQVMLEFVRASSTGLEHVLEHGTSHRGHGGIVLASSCMSTVLTQREFCFTVRGTKLLPSYSWSRVLLHVLPNPPAMIAWVLLYNRHKSN